MVSPIAAFDRLGTESAFQVLARAAALQASGKDVINLGIGQPNFPPPPHVIDAAAKALRDGHHNGYTPAAGVMPLREAVAADLCRRRGTEVSPDQVLIVPGGKVTMFLAILMFGEPGAEILYPDPGFPIYESLIRFTGATAVPVPLREDRGFAFAAEDVLNRITPQSRLLIINSPANPTGGVVPKAVLDQLADGLLGHPQLAILSDEIYSRILYDGAEHASMLAYPQLADRLILLDGWSKTYAMTGWRLGYGVWPQRLFPYAERMAINSHSCVNAVAQAAALSALSGPQDAVDQMVASFAGRRDLMLAELSRIPGLTCATPGGAFYCFPNIQATGHSARSLQDRLLNEAGIATLAGTSFGANGEGFLRLSYATDDDSIRQAMQRIGDWLADHGGRK